MKTVLCYVHNMDSNITSHNKYIKVKPRLKNTEQTTKDSFEEKKIPISLAGVPKGKYIQKFIFFWIELTFLVETIFE